MQADVIQKLENMCKTQETRIRKLEKILNQIKDRNSTEYEAVPRLKEQDPALTKEIEANPTQCDKTDNIANYQKDKGHNCTDTTRAYYGSKKG